MILLINNAKPNMADLHYIKYIRNVLKKNKIDFIETKKIEDISLKTNKKIQGIIISGSPLKLSEPLLLEEYGYILHYLLHLPNIPVLGICFGCQLLSMICSGFQLDNQNKYICDTQPVRIDNTHPLFLQNISQKPLNHFQFCFSDVIIPNKKMKNVREIAWFHYKNKKTACAFDFTNHKYGTLFHPEYLEETHFVLLNFYQICLSI
jgi:GMP synthase-like glutamine amidotransferase